MTDTNLRPGTRCPDLDVALLDGSRLKVAQLPSDKRTLIIFYRGLHCPKCKTQLREFDAAMARFRDLGVRPVAVSMDDKNKAHEAQRDWELKKLPVGYDVDETVARNWGLFISNAEFDYEPEIFCEPGLFLVEPDGKLYAAWIQSTPFARPRCDDLVSALQFVNEKRYPPRGKAA